MPAPWAAVAQARIIGEIHGQKTVNVMHFATNTVINDATQLNQLLQTLVQALLDCALEFLLPAVTQDWRLIECDAKQLHPAKSDPVIATANAGSIGELSPSSVSFAASLLSIRTGQGGRRGRGRIFLPPPGEAEITNSSIDPATGLLLVAFANCIAQKFGGANPTTEWRIGVLSTTTLKGAGGSYDNAFQLATQLSPVVDLAVMRSRKKRKGS